MTVDKILDNTFLPVSCGSGCSTLSSGTICFTGYGCGSESQIVGIDTLYGYGSGKGNNHGGYDFEGCRVK